MKLKRSLLLYRWAFSLSPIKPYQVSLCELFWRVVLFTPFTWGVLILLVGISLFGTFVLPIMVFGWWGLLLALVLGLLIWAVLAQRWDNREQREKSLLLSYIKAKKARWCPIITVERD